MRLNRKWLLAIAMVLSLSVATGGTLAYLTDHDTVENTFTVGNVDIELTEPSYTSDNQPLLPGVTIPKDPMITNSGNTAAWVWMKVTLPTAMMEYIDWNTAAWDRSTETDSTDTTKTVVTLKRTTKLPAEAGSNTTAAAFTKVSLPASLTTLPTSIAEETTIDIKVDAYAIQDAGFANVDMAIRAFGGEIFESGSYTEVNSAAGLVAALEVGNNVTLTESLNIEKIDLTSGDKDVVIDANNETITTTDALGIEVGAGKNVTLTNANVVMTKEGDYLVYAAGFKINNGDYQGKTITLRNCKITMANDDWAYAVNMPAGVQNLNLVIDNCVLEGAIAVQCWGDNNTITITNSELICNYGTNEMYGSQCVALQSDGTHVSENNTVTISNCEFKYSGTNNYNQDINAYVNNGTDNVVTVTNCTYGEGVTNPDASDNP